MNYQFENINAGLTIKAPSISIDSIIDDFKGNAFVNVAITLGAPQAQAVDFVVVGLGVYTYQGDQALKADVEAWVEAELVKHQI